MTRNCPKCAGELPALAIRCPTCGADLPEARDVRSDPGQPACNVCQAPMGLMDLACPKCGTGGYPAMRPRRGKKSLGAPEEGR